VLLRGLGREDVGRFIELASGVTPPAGMVEAVHRQTQGNPLFVTEVVRLLAQEGELTQEKAGQRDSWSVRIPEGVREVIGRRLDRLSQRCNETLTTASILGREFTLDQLKPLSEDTSDDRLFEVLEEALAARVIEELPQSVGRYQFTHALIQETLAEELSPTRRVRLHARIAEALEEMYGDDADAHAAELAHHFAQAEAMVGTEKLVRYSLVAGERALANYAWEEAQAHFQRGLAAKDLPLEGDYPARDSDEAALLFGFGRGLASAAGRNQWQQAVDSVGRAFDYYHSVGDIPRAVEAAEYSLPVLSGARTAMATFYGRALELLDHDSITAARLLSSHGAELGRVDGDYLGGQQAFDQALTIARNADDESLEVRILAASGNVDLFHLHLEESLEKAFKVIEVTQATHESRLEMNARLDAARVLTGQGDSEGARRQSTACLELVEKLRDRQRLALACRADSTLCRLLGEWPRARAISDRGLTVAPQDVILLGDRVLLEYEFGEWERGESYLERFVETMRGAPSRARIRFAGHAVVLPQIARLTESFELLDIAVTAAETVLASPAAEPIFAMISRIGLAMVAVLRRDTELAETQYSLLASAAPALFGASPINTQRLLGLLAQTMGNMDQAAVHYEDSLAFCRKAGYRPELAWTCCDYADALRERGGNDGDRAKAVALLDESLSISSELGMRPLMERVLSRREILKA